MATYHQTDIWRHNSSRKPSKAPTSSSRHHDRAFSENHATYAPPEYKAPNTTQSSSFRGKISAFLNGQSSSRHNRVPTSTPVTNHHNHTRTPTYSSTDNQPPSYPEPIRDDTAASKKLLEQNQDQSFRILHLERKVDDMKKAHEAKIAEIATLNSELTALRAAHTELQSQHATLRNVAQVRESRDSQEVVGQFTALNTEIRNISHSLCNSIMDQYRLPDNMTTSGIADAAALSGLLRYAPDLLKSPKGAGRRLDLFLEVLIRSWLCWLLRKNPFNLFHPGSTSEHEDNLLRDVYNDIRSREPQFMAARWRCLTHTSIDHRDPTRDENSFGLEFCQTVAKRLLPHLLYGVVGPRSAQQPFLFKERDALVKLGRSAFAWNHSIKSTFVPQDFIVEMVRGRSTFDDNVMEIEGEHDSKKKSYVVACVGLGLRSTVSHGTQGPAESVWQCKPTVVSEEYF